MVIRRLIDVDKRISEQVQKKFNLSNYQMLCLSWLIGLSMGIGLTVVFL